MSTHLANQQRSRGDAFFAAATKKLSERTWMAAATERKNEEAAGLFEQAANAFKVAGADKEAGDAFAQAAEVYTDKLSNVLDGSKCWASAGSSYKKVNAADAIKAFRKAIGIYLDNGRILQAAKTAKETAEIFEEDESGDSAENIKLAVESYEQAAEFFNMENQKSQGNQCMGKVAELLSAASDPPDFIRAANIYDGLGKNCLESNLLKFNAKGYFLQSLLCFLASGDSIGASQALNRYDAIDYTFGESREGKFAASLVSCVENLDPEGFATACMDYDRITKLDPWKTSILVKVKRTIGGGMLDSDENDVDLT